MDALIKKDYFATRSEDDDDFEFILVPKPKKPKPSYVQTAMAWIQCSTRATVAELLVSLIDTHLLGKWIIAFLLREYVLTLAI